MGDTSITLGLMLQLTRSILTDAVHAIVQYDKNEYIKTLAQANAETIQSVNQKFADVHKNLSAEADWDFEYILNRAANEWESFFTKSLPLLGKRLDSCLCLQSAFDPLGFVKKKPRRKSVLFGWLFDRVLVSGVLPHETSCALAVKLIRQLTYLFYKYELPYSHEQATKVVSSFIETEKELPEASSYDDDLVDPVLCLAANLIANVVHRFDASEIIPKHGPGAVATGEKPWTKMRFARIYKSLEEFYPFTEWMVPSLNYVVDEYQHMQNRLQTLDTGTAKVVLVHKDSRGPRLISCEPLEYQWIQQGISKQLVKLIESHKLTKGRVNFTDQEINRRHALWGSMGTQWVTLDLKDASDRVTTALVRRLFRKTSLLQYLLASRSTATKLPDGNIITLKKFAPMGSALCFPVEALVFWALSVASLHINTGLKLERALACVKVYGDDIITSAEGCADVVKTLEMYHLKVNTAKCCVAGSFRESCGMDAYRGVDVTPIKIRSIWSSKVDCNTIISYVELSNEFYRRQLYDASTLLESYVRHALINRNRGVKKHDRLVIPTIADESPRSYLAFRRAHVVDDFKGVASRYNPVYQRTEVRAPVSQPSSIFRKRPGYELLFRALINLEHRESACKAESPRAQTCSTNVQSYPLRGRVSLKPRWCRKA